MTGTAAKRRKLSKQSADDDRDVGETSNETNQDSAQPGLAEQFTSSANGNGSSQVHFPAVAHPRHQPPIHPFFNANSTRLYPEWSLPEPVAAPHRANGFWGSSWSQPQYSPVTQAALTQALPEPVQLQGPAASISDTQTASRPLEAAPLQPPQASDTQPAALQLPAAEPAASAQPLPRSPLHDVVSEQAHHPSTGQVSLTQPSSSIALLHHTSAGASAESPLHSTALQVGPAQRQLPASELRSANEVAAREPWSASEVMHRVLSQQQPQQQQQPQLPGQQQQPQPPCQQQQQQAGLQQAGHEQIDQQQTQDMPPGQQPPQQSPQQLPQQLPGEGLAQAPGDVEATDQQPGPGLGPGPGSGPSEEAPAAAATNVGAYSQRELFLQNLEEAGDMSFEYVLNDGQRHNSVWLIALKNIFSKQLPNMPREYIARLVLDRRHRSVAIIRRKRNVVGGITYRPFHKQHFGEIAFCAVTANEQVKGFGTRLMNYTKGYTLEGRSVLQEYAKNRDQLTHFLTYADNNAVGYFSKQGFTKEITLDKEWWVGYIKDYDGGTLMECVIVQRLPHTRLPAMLQAQKRALDSRIRQYSKSHFAHAGLSAFQEGCRRVDISSIPGVKEAGWDPGDSCGRGVKLVMNNSALDATPNNLQHFMLMVVHEMQQHEDAWAFLHPVSLQDVPDYLDIIKDPMDLSLMEQRLKKKDYYLTLDIFAADMRRICNNARIYNAGESPYYKSANRLEAFFDQYMHAHLLFGL